MDVRIPALCGHCGGAFVGLTATDRPENSTITVGAPDAAFECPYCHLDAYLMQGVFGKVEDGRVGIIAVSATDADRLGRLTAILEDAQAGRIKDMDAIRRLVSEAPELRPYLEYLTPANAMAFIGLILAIITMAMAIANPAATPAQVHSIVEQAITQTVQQSHDLDNADTQSDPKSYRAQP